MILNQPKSRKRDIKIERNGRITLRARPCSSLHLQQGDRVVFCLIGEQMYLYRDNDAGELALPLYGRSGQLHVCSVATAKALMNHVRNLPHSAGCVELIASTHVRTINVADESHQAIAVINVI